MRNKTVLALLLSVAFVIGVTASADAFGTYLTTFNSTYDTAGTALDTCGLCHVNPGGGGDLNPYGNSFASTHDFLAIESMDSDGDTFTNIVEINARTFPGDPMSYPMMPATIPAPVGSQVIPPFVVPDVPTVSVDPSLAKPIGIGALASGGDTLTIRISLAQFAVPMDIYAAFVKSSNPDVLVNVNSGGQLVPIPISQVFQAVATGQPPAGVTPFMSNVSTAIDETPFANIPAGNLEPGTYTAFLLATPTGGITSFYRWRTSFTIGVPITVLLSGDQEVPPVSTTGSGTANIFVNITTGRVTGTIAFSGLTSPATAAHYHQEVAGSNGPVIIGLSPPADTSGVIDVSTTLTPEQLSALAADGLYFNIHTSTNPGGEIRGQIVYPMGAPLP